MNRKWLAAFGGGLAGAAALGVGIFFAVQSERTAANTRMLEAFAAQLPPSVSMEYAGLRRGAGGEVVASNVQFSGEQMGRVAVREVVLRDIDTENRVPTRVDMAFRGITIPLEEADAKIRQAVAELGYDKLELHVDYGYRFSPADERLELTRLQLRIPGVASLQIRARLGNLATVDFPDENAAMRAFLKLMVEGGEVVYRDESLVRRLLRLRARKMGISEGELVQRIVARIDARMGRAPNASVRDTLAAIRDFVENPGEIALTVHPRQPINAMRLMLLKDDPAEIQELLGLTVAAR